MEKGPSIREYLDTPLGIVVSVGVYDVILRYLVLNRDLSLDLPKILMVR